jgi:hypothetical protein
VNRTYKCHKVKNRKALFELLSNYFDTCNQELLLCINSQTQSRRIRDTNSIKIKGISFLVDSIRIFLKLLEEKGIVVNRDNFEELISPLIDKRIETFFSLLETEIHKKKESKGEI